MSDPSQFSGGTGGAAQADEAATKANESGTTSSTASSAGAPSGTLGGAGSRLNPYRDAEPFRLVLIDGVELPLVLSIDGCGTPEEWTVQKGTDKSFATTVWKGSKLAEDIAIECALFSLWGYDRAITIRDRLRPQRGQKPPSLVIVNPTINFGGITRIGVKDPGFPKWESSGGYWKWKISLIEYNPTKNANTGPADPNNPDKGGATANTDASKAREDITATAGKP